MDIFEIHKEKNFNVVKSNELIQKSRYDLTLQEQKIVLRLIQLIKPDDEKFKLYNFSIRDFCQLCNIDFNNGKNYQDIKQTIQKLRDKSFWINLNNGSMAMCSWINKAIISYNSGIIQIRLDDDLIPYLLQLKSNFTSYSYLYILGMKSKYSIRFYELLKSYQYKKIVVFEVEELKRLLCAEKYIYFCNLNQKVIKPAIKEINDITDINVNYTYVKSGRKINALKLFISTKNTKDLLNSFDKLKGV